MSYRLMSEVRGACALTLAFGGLLSAVSADAQQTPPPLVFRGVTVIDVRAGQRLLDQTVVVVDRRITAVAPAQQAPVPPGARVVDARGQYLIPGLWDMNVHVQGYADLAYPLFIANGVTGVRDAGSLTPLATVAQWKREIAAGTRVGPRQVVAGPLLYSDVGNGPVDSTHPVYQKLDHMYVLDSVLPRVIDSLQAAGADILETELSQYNGRDALLTEGRQKGILIGGSLVYATPYVLIPWSHPLITPLEASDSGATFLEYGAHPCNTVEPEEGRVTPPFYLTGAPCAAAVQRFRDNHSWSVLAPFPPDSLTGQSAAAWHARLRIRARRYLPDSFPWPERTGRAAAADARLAVREPAATADWATAAPHSSLAQLVADSVPMLMGTDANLRWAPMYYAVTPGFAVHEGLVNLVLHGATPLAALQTATLNPALALRAADSLGTVEAGKLADLVLLDADPLADIWNTTKIRAVVANGRYYDRAALDQLLKAAERAARQAPPYPAH